MSRVKLKKGYVESFSIVFDDGTGVIYYGCDPGNAQYGKMNYDGALTEAYGYIVTAQ